MKIGYPAKVKEWTRHQLQQSAAQFKEINWVFASIFALFGLTLVVCAPESARGYAIGAGVALFIAFVAYPWQKGRDRTNELRREQREAYKEYLVHILEVEDNAYEITAAEFENLESVDSKLQAFQNVKNKLDNQFRLLSLVGSKEVLVAANDIRMSVNSLISTWREDIRVHTQAAERIGSPRLRQIMRASVIVKRKEWLALENKLRDEMRMQEFGVVTGAKFTFMHGRGEDTEYGGAK